MGGTGKFVRVVEVGPRDGLQNEPEIVPTAVKAQFITRLADAGFAEIEVGSFVSPKRVPQMADTAELFALLPPRPHLRYSALVPNAKGLENALKAGVRAISLFTAASEAFNRQNIGMTIAESLAGFQDLLPTARANHCRVRAYVSTAFHCPYAGRVAPESVLAVVRELNAMGVDEISIGDTLGHAVPDEVALLTESLLPELPRERFAYHFHDTRHTALANVEKALEYDIAIFDSAAGGAGGCPFAPGAKGNLATEDLLSLLHHRNFSTGISLDNVVAATRFLESVLGRPLRRT